MKPKLKWEGDVDFTGQIMSTGMNGFSIERVESPSGYCFQLVDQRYSYRIIGRFMLLDVAQFVAQLWAENPMRYK